MPRPCALLLVALLVASACGGGSDAGSRAAVSIAVGEPEALFVERVAHATGDHAEAVRSAEASIDAFWAEQYPSVYGVAYRGVDALEGLGPGDEATCGDARRAYRDVKGRVLYCELDDRILYDDARLVPELHAHFGDLAVGAVLARAWGRAVQARSGFDRSGAPADVVDLQADCLAGAWLGAHGPATGDGALDAAVAGFLVAGGSWALASDEAAPPSAPDRVLALRDGIDRGVAACTAYADPATAPVSAPVAPGSGRGQGRDPAAWHEEVAAALDAFWVASLSGFAPIEDADAVGGDGVECDGEVWTPGAGELSSYCTAEHRVVVHGTDELEAITAVLGPGAVLGVLADAWARAAAVSLGFTSDPDAHGLVLDCLAGASAGGLLAASDAEPGGTLGGAQILDGALAAVLVVEQLRDEHLGGLARAGAFATGYSALAHARSGPADACRPFL